MKAYKPQQPVTIYDVIKQRDAAREQARSLIRERDQLRMLCQITAHYLTYLPMHPTDLDHEMIGRLEAAAKGDMDVAAQPQTTPPAQAGPRGAVAGPLPASAGQAGAAAPSVQGHLQHPPAPDPGEGRTLPKDVTLTTVEKKLVKAIGQLAWSYDELCGALDIPRDRIITAMHHLRSMGLVTREGPSWRRA